MKNNKLFIVLVTMGVLLMLYPLFTYIYAHYSQFILQAQLNRDAEQNQIPAIGTPPHQTPVITDFNGAVIKLPSINVTVAVLRGTSDDVLAKGPGWYEESALPGQGNTAIAGHRTMYGSWFRNLDSLQAGDPISIVCEGHEFVYSVERVFTVARDDWSVIDPLDYPALTLTTCHPVGSAKQRLVVRAALNPSGAN